MLRSSPLSCLATPRTAWCIPSPLHSYLGISAAERYIPRRIEDLCISYENTRPGSVANIEVQPAVPYQPRRGGQEACV
jgi:hypothetical protein